MEGFLSEKETTADSYILLLFPHPENISSFC